MFTVSFKCPKNHGHQHSIVSLKDICTLYDSAKKAGILDPMKYKLEEQNSGRLYSWSDYTTGRNQTFNLLMPNQLMSSERQNTLIHRQILQDLAKFSTRSKTHVKLQSSRPTMINRNAFKRSVPRLSRTANHFKENREKLLAEGYDADIESMPARAEIVFTNYWNESTSDQSWDECHNSTIEQPTSLPTENDEVHPKSTELEDTEETPQISLDNTAVERLTVLSAKAVNKETIEVRHKIDQLEGICYIIVSLAFLCTTFSIYVFISLKA